MTSSALMPVSGEGLSSTRQRFAFGSIEGSARNPESLQPLCDDESPGAGKRDKGPIEASRTVVEHRRLSSTTAPRGEGIRMAPVGWTRGCTPRHFEMRSIAALATAFLGVLGCMLAYAQPAEPSAVGDRGYATSSGTSTDQVGEQRAPDVFDGMDRGAADREAAKRGEASAAAADAKPGATATTAGEKFPTPERAVKAMVDALRSGDHKRLEAVFGPTKGIFDTGDAIADKRERDRFLRYYDQKNTLANPDGVMVTLTVGESEWPFPIPIVKHPDGYYFSTAAGAQAIVHRRIGRNELGAISVCNTYLAAQKEYALVGHDGLPAGLYAQTLVSDAGKQNGLYWPAPADGLRSPIGSLLAQATDEGYRRDASGKPTAYHGYFFKTLRSQSSRARSGAKTFVVDGKQVGGFALVAYPAQYAQSGVKTFIINQDGVLYEKNLGEDTVKIAAAMQEYDPDGSWSPGH